MKQIPYNKLVRDRIPDIIAADGRAYEVEVLGEEAYRRALRRKLVEEAHEAEKAQDRDLVKELADLLEVMYVLVELHSITWEDVEDMQRARRSSRGGFEERLMLLWAEEDES